MPIQGLTDLSKLAEIVEAGLPNIEGTAQLSRTDGFCWRVYSSSGALSSSGTGSIATDTDTKSGSGINTLSFNASNSSPIYGNSDTVQQEQIQYPYFIQVATGRETEDNIINEIELNNPFSLLDYKYSEYELNNLSWLRSEGQFNTKIVYPAVYDLLLKIYNGTETKAGVSVKLSTDGYTDYDFVLNTAEETFRLPIKVKLASGKAVAGNGMTVGLTNGSMNAGLSFVGGTSGIGLTDRTENYGQPVGVRHSTNAGFPESISVGITLDSTKSGIETSDSDLYLYFYVGETVQNANLINAGRVMEEAVLRSSLVEAQVVIETYQNGSSGYRIWSDGYCEQWGVMGKGATQVITLLKPYINGNYVILVGQFYTGATDMHGTIKSDTKTQTGFTIVGHANVSFNWKTSGYIW